MPAFRSFTLTKAISSAPPSSRAQGQRIAVACSFLALECELVGLPFPKSGIVFRDSGLDLSLGENPSLSARSRSRSLILIFSSSAALLRSLGAGRTKEVGSTNPGPMGGGFRIMKFCGGSLSFHSRTNESAVEEGQRTLEAASQLTFR